MLMFTFFETALSVITQGTEYSISWKMHVYVYL